MEVGKVALTPEDVALKLGICRKTVYTMLKDNKLPHIKCGTLYIIPIPAFEKWLIECNRSKTNGIAC